MHPIQAQLVTFDEVVASILDEDTEIILEDLQLGTIELDRRIVANIRD